MFLISSHHCQKRTIFLVTSIWSKGKSSSFNYKYTEANRLYNLVKQFSQQASNVKWVSSLKEKQNFVEGFLHVTSQSSSDKTFLDHFRIRQSGLCVTVRWKQSPQLCLALHQSNNRQLIVTSKTSLTQAITSIYLCFVTSQLWSLL